MSPDAPRRLALLAGVVLVVVGVSVAQAVVPAPEAPAAAAAPASAVVSDSSASTSVWYCAGPAAAPAGSQASVFLTNPGPRPVAGSLHTATTSGAATDQQFVVPALGQVGLAVPLAAVEVLLEGGGVGVFQQLSNPLGSSAAACASNTSANWYFSEGSTANGAGLQVAVFNPLPTPAVVSVSFVSPSGPVVPPAYQGIPLAAGAVAVENVADHAPGDASLAAVVDALSGAVVASEMEEGGSPGSGVFSVDDGANALQPQWSFAQNANPNGGGTTFTVVNPSMHPATVTASISLTQGRSAPIVLQVPTQSSTSLSSQSQTRIPGGAVFGMTFRAAAASGIIVGRQVSVPGGPLPVNALANGQPGGSAAWLVPPMPPGPAAGSLAFVNLAGRALHVTIVGFGPPGAIAPPRCWTG